MSHAILLILCATVIVVAAFSAALTARRRGSRIAGALVSLLLVGAFWRFGEAIGRSDAFDSGSLAVDLAAIVSLILVPLIAVQVVREALSHSSLLRWDPAQRRRDDDVVVPPEGLAAASRNLGDDVAARLSRAQAHFSDFASQSRAGLWIHDVVAGELVWVSPAFESIWGRSAEALYADSARRIAAVHDEDRSRVAKGLTRACEGADYAEEYRVQRPDGSVVWVWDHAVAVRGADGRVSTLAGFAEDITRRKGVEEVNLFRANFVANMSHEVRTPLNIMIGYLEFLLDGTFGDLSPQQRDVAARIRSNAEDLLELMSASLDLSRLDNQGIPVTIEAIDVGGLVAEVVEDAQALVNGGDVVVRAEIAVGLPTLVSDRQKLKMVLKNLLSNAAKFTSTGEIVVGARPDAEGGVDLFVRDTGAGIAPEFLPRVFEPFRQGGGAETKATGVGLGLYIVRRLVDILEGRISVESALGKGSSFHVWLPQSMSPERDGADGDASV